MRKDVHNIDDFFRGEMESYKEDPRKEIWDALEARLDKEDARAYKKKFNFSRRVTLALLLLLLGFVLYEAELVGKTYRYFAGTKSDKQAKQNAEAVKPGTRRLELTRAGDIIKQASPVLEQRTDESGKVTKEDKYTSLESRDTKSNKTDTVKTNDIGHSVKTADGHIAAGNSITQRYGRFEANASRHKSVHAGANAVSQMATTGHHAQQGNLTGAANDEDAFFKASDSPDFLLQPLSILPVMYNRLYDIGKISGNTLRNLQDSVDLLKNTAGGLPHTKRNTAFRPQWELTVIASPQLSGSDLDNDADDHNGARDDEEAEIKNRERYRFSYTAGALVSWQFSRRWILQSGLLYSNTHISIDPQDIYAAQDNGTLAYKYNSSSGYAYVKTKSGLPQAVGDSILAKNAQQHISYLGIPVLVKYRMANKKISITPGLGISVNLLTRATMQTALERGINSEQVMVSKLKGTRTLFLGAMFNTAIQYHFSGKWAFDIMPSFSYSITSITKDNVVNTYPYNLGIGVGITYAF